MSLNVNYEMNGSTIFRSYNHLKFAVCRDLGPNREPANKMEIFGNKILNIVGCIPRAIKGLNRLCHDPRIVTIALTTFALYVTSLLFYPSTTLSLTKEVLRFTVKMAEKIPYWVVKFAAYIISCTAIIGYGLRAEGRFTNAPLLRQFYKLPTSVQNPASMSNEQIKKVLRETQTKATGTKG